jgi:Leucine rich repeat
MTKKGKDFEEPSVTAKGVELQSEETAGNTAQALFPPPVDSNEPTTTISTRPEDTQYVPSRIPRHHQKVLEQKLAAEGNHGVGEHGETTENSAPGPSPPLAITNDPVTTATTSTTHPKAQCVRNTVPRHIQKDQKQKEIASDHYHLDNVEDVGPSGVALVMAKAENAPSHLGVTHTVKFPLQNKIPHDATEAVATDALAERSSEDHFNTVLFLSSTSDAAISSDEDRPGAYREGGPDDADDTNTAYFTYPVEETSTIMVLEPPGQDEEALEAEVVTERNLQQEVQERMERITIDPISVKLSQPDNNDGDTRTGSRQKCPRLAMVIMAALVLLAAVGATVGSRTVMRSKKSTSTEQPLAPDTPTASPTSISDYLWELARDLLTSVSGEEALSDESSPQYGALSWIVHDDPIKLLSTMVQNNDFPSSSSLIVERYVLVLLYFVTNGDNWTYQVFNGNTSTCEWVDALDCNEEGSVVGLYLGKYDMPTLVLRFGKSCKLKRWVCGGFKFGFCSANLYAKPNSKCFELCDRRVLPVVNTEFNNLNGTLPSELYALSSIEGFNMVGNGLQGTIPSSLGKLSQLQSLNLGENTLSGSLPESLFSLLKLEMLDLNENELTGSVPKLSSPSLEKLKLYTNFLTGTISDSDYDSLENMRSIQLDSNLLSGSIPESIYSSKLEILSLWDNQISGSLSNKIGRCAELNYLDLSTNDLTGTIPSAIRSLSNLEGLYLDQNAFTGTIPSDMGLLTRIRELSLQNNQLSGTVPVEFSSLSPVFFTLQFNNITGSLDMVCKNQTAIFPFVNADCGGLDPEVECSCCVTCCDSFACAVNNTNACLVEKSEYDSPEGLQYIESAGTVCECISSDIDNAISFSCMDTQCQSCNLDGTVCSINKQYQFRHPYDQDPYMLKFQATYQYVVGHNDTVTLETTQLPDASVTCEVTVNGQMCNGCFFSMCLDGFVGLNVDCYNVEGASAIDMCDEKRDDDNGPLAVFAFQDPAFLQGCPPRIWPNIIY